MLERIGHVAESGSDLIDIKVQRAHRSGQRLASAMVGYTMAGVLGAAGVLGLLGTAYLVLASMLGPAGALATVSAAGLLLAGGILLTAHRVASPHRQSASDRKLQESEAAAKGRMRSALGMRAEGEGAEKGGDDGDWMSYVPGLLRKAMRNGELIGSAGFTLVALLGPARSFRLIGRAATWASTLAPLARAVEHASRDETSRSEGEPAARTAEAGSGNGRAGPQERGPQHAEFKHERARDTRDQ